MATPTRKNASVLDWLNETSTWKFHLVVEDVDTRITKLFIEAKLLFIWHLER